MKLIRTATVATLLLAVVTAIGLPRSDEGLTHWSGSGWLTRWSLIQYADEGSIQVSVGGRVVVDSYWSRTAEQSVDRQSG